MNVCARVEVDGMAEEMSTDFLHGLTVWSISMDVLPHLLATLCSVWGNPFHIDIEYVVEWFTLVLEPLWDLLFLVTILTDFGIITLIEKVTHLNGYLFK